MTTSKGGNLFLEMNGLNTRRSPCTCPPVKRRMQFWLKSLILRWYYIYAQQEDDQASQIVVSGSPPTMAAQQLWWNLRVESGLIVEVIPARVGFGV